jgi:hypothetical protein
VRRASGLLVAAITLAAFAHAWAAETTARPALKRPAPVPTTTKPPVTAPPAVQRAGGAPRPVSRTTVAPAPAADPGTSAQPAKPVGWGGFLGELGPHIRRTLAATRLRPIPWGAPQTPDPPSGAKRAGGPQGGSAAPGDRPAPAQEMRGDLPVRLELGAVIPNPSEGNVSLALSLPTAASVRVSVIDVAGRIVHESVGSRAAGRYVLSWSGRDMGDARVLPGVYFVRVLVDGRPLGTRRWVVMR